MDVLGTSVTFRIVTPGAHDPETGKGSVTNTDTALNGTLYDYEIKEVDGTVIQFGDRRLIVAASDLTTEPKPDHRIIVGTDNYRIVRSRPIQATDQAAAYELQLRRG